MSYLEKREEVKKKLEGMSYGELRVLAVKEHMNPKFMNKDLDGLREALLNHITKG
jgi:hypothetical protein